MENGDDLIRRQDALEALRMCYETERIDYTNGNEYINYEQAVHEVEQLPSAQPKYEELTPVEAASEIASGSTMFARYCLDAMIQLKQMGYAICRKR